MKACETKGCPNEGRAFEVAGRGVCGGCGADLVDVKPRRKPPVKK